jgi:arylsulfatase
VKLPCALLLLAAALGCSGDFQQRGEAQIVRRLSPDVRPAGDPAGSARLLVAEGEARRGWSVPVGSTLVIPLEAKPGSRVEVSFALPTTNTAPGPGFANIEVELGAATPESVHHRERIRRGTGWSSLSLDLPAHAGGPVELRLSSRSESVPQPAHDAIYWGEIIVIEPATHARPRSVVLVTLDTTRADVAADAAIAPNLSALSQRAVVFEQAWSPATSTTPAHASLLTGLPVDRHGVRSNRSRLSEHHRTLAEVLAENGYQTAAAVSVPHLEPRAGLGQGFDRFLLARPGAGADGALTLAGVEVWLDEWRRHGDRPYFLWLHIFDPHTPYGGPRAWRDGPWAERGFALPARRATPPTVPIFPGPLPTPLAWLSGIDSRAHVDALYRAGVAYADHLLGRLLAMLEEAGEFDETLLVVTADHGEALGERGVWYQHTGLWPESLRVPLTISAPGGASGRRVVDPVSTQDVFPTILSALGLASPREAERDLLRESRAHGAATVWFADSDLSLLGLRDAEVHVAHALRRGQFGVLTRERDGAPFVRGIQRYEPGRSWLFDINADPLLERDLSSDPGSGIDAYQVRVRTRARDAVPNTPRLELAPGEQRGLEALGYGAGEDGPS